MIRELPAAVSAAGWPATVLTPSYGLLHQNSGAQEIDPVVTQFRGRPWDVRVFVVPGSNRHVRYVVFDHKLLVPTDTGVVYHDDDATRPFATDANKFAFFCAASASWIESRRTPPAAIHLHDWHTAIVAVLREFDSGFPQLRAIPQYFTIHNLAYQGQRPMRGDESSLEEWFPDLRYDGERLTDPQNRQIFNPMATAIRLADRVNAVSPTYAKEIQQPSDPSSGFVGGEGLESDLQRRATEGRLFGILNGCDYSNSPTTPPRWPKLLDLCKQTLLAWGDDSSHQVALHSLAKLPRRRPLHVLTSVGRVVDQKMRLFFEKTNTGQTALQDILDDLGDSGVFVLLGSGEPRYEKQLLKIARSSANFIYCRGYSEELGDALYAGGDLFLMPSSFEPCGISQMLAMRNGQPCLAHGVGGLCDTIDDGINGFIFEGVDPRDQAIGFVECVRNALRMRGNDPLRWQTIRNNALAARFDWASSAKQYIELFYEHRNAHRNS